MNKPAKLFVLRATEKITYDCPDNGLTHLDDKYEDLAFSAGRQALDERAADLNKGFGGRYWSERHANALRKLHADYDEFRERIYLVADISDLVELPPAHLQETP